MGVTKTLQAASGWLELGIADEALSELERLPREVRTQREALELQLAAQMVNQSWNSASDTAASFLSMSTVVFMFSDVAPDCCLLSGYPIGSGLDIRPSRRVWSYLVPSALSQVTGVPVRR